MGKKTVRQKLNILTPDIRTIYLGKGMKQKADYIQLHRNFSDNILEKDIAAGAGIYRSFPEVLKLNPSKYNIITASSREDGLRAVAYLAGKYAADEGNRPESIEDDLFDSDENYALKYNLKDEEMIFVGDEDEEEDWVEIEDEESSASYVEAFDRIPVIGLEEVIEMNPYRQNPVFSPFGYEVQSNTSRPRPWWTECEEESICIVKEQNDCFFSSEILNDVEIKALKRFRTNSRVYLVVISDEIREDDYSINTAVLEYTANAFRVDTKAKAISDYYKILFEQEASSHGFTLSRGVDVALLSDRISNMDKDYPCRRFKKVMDYLIHVGAPSVLKASDFDCLGLKKLIDKDRNTSALTKMENELIGMDEVKKQIRNIIDTLKYFKLRAGRDFKISGFHNVHLFVGSPGTAKSTMAKLMMTMMKDEGLLPGNRFVSVTGAQLKGAFVGQTAPKVHALFEQNDAIFIDEAYSLACGSEVEGGLDSYSQEALAQLAVELEEHAMDKLVIFAGYGGRNINRKNNLMHKFLTSNPGISSRINSTIYFDSYKPEDMVAIVHKLASNTSLEMSAENDGMIADYFDKRQNENDFGNGREARVLLEKCERCVAKRIAGIDPGKVTDSELNTILPEDISKALDEMSRERKDMLGEYSIRFGLA
ncbi:MAG: AAA family ATPase [Lachnospiraceae bacterium]|nr:AAA family ATPase [Lachnospiraceae bacterium]